MSPLMCALYPERFIPPQGTIRLIRDASLISNNQERRIGVAELKENIYQLIAAGFSTDSEIGYEVERTEDCVRTYLQVLASEGRIKRVHIARMQKDRYFLTDAEVNISDYIKPPKVRPSKKAGTTKSIKVRAEYIKLIKSGINKSFEIAQNRKQSTGGTLATLYRMERDGIIRQAGKSPGTGLGSAPIIWEVV